MREADQGIAVVALSTNVSWCEQADAGCYQRREGLFCAAALEEPAWAEGEAKQLGGLYPPT